MKTDIIQKARLLGGSYLFFTRNPLFTEFPDYTAF